MKEVAQNRQRDPRARQKARTRAALVEAGQHLLAEHATPTVATVADQAGVSRATAYRYFPTRESLLFELESDSLFAPVYDVLDHFTSEDPEDRLIELIDAIERLVATTEPEMRRGLRFYQDTWLRGNRGGDSAPTVRQGRRMAWFDKVLEHASELPDGRRRRLKEALALTVGADPFVMLKDVCHISNREAFDVLRWTAVAILRTALRTTTRRSRRHNQARAHEAGRG
jgi:AcrR family transcriptional regulator